MEYFIYQLVKAGTVQCNSNVKSNAKNPSLILVILNNSVLNKYSGGSIFFNHIFMDDVNEKVFLCIFFNLFLYIFVCS